MNTLREYLNEQANADHFQTTMVTTQNFNDHVRIEANGDIGVATTVLERPAHRNAVDCPVEEALSAAFARFAEEPAWRAAVLFDAGGTFRAGGDRAVFDERVADAARFA